MAEEKDTNQGGTVNSFNKGLHQDLHPENQPEGTYRFALNAVLESQEGDFNALTTEQANYECTELPEGFVPIGSIYMTDDERLVFLSDKSETNQIIGVLKNCTFTSLIETDCLGFKLNKPIRGIFRIRNGCERNIYFVDAYNPDRHINIDNLDRYKDSDGNYVCSEFNLVGCISEVLFSYSQTFNDGGSTRIGVFQLAARYVDEYGNALPATQLTRPYYVANGDYSFSSTQAGYNSNMAVDGGLLSNNQLCQKSFEFLIENVNKEFPYLEIIVLETYNGSSTAHIIDRLNTTTAVSSINNDTIFYTYRGVNSNTARPITLQEIVTKDSRSLTSAAITQIDNRLIRANMSEPSIDWTPFLRAALKTDVKYYIEEAEADNTKKPDGKTSFMGDEVYSLGVRWIIDDCIESPVFHIPGRDYINDADLKDLGNSNIHNRTDALTNNWDLETLDVIANAPGQASSGEIMTREVEFLRTSGTPQDEFNRWQVFNTAIKTDDQTISAGSQTPVESGYMAYHQSSCEFYPDQKDCNGNPLWAIYDEEGNLEYNFANQPVRHHKMPDRTLEPHHTNSNNFHEVVLRNIKPLVLTQFPEGWDLNRLKYQIVAVPRNAENSTVIDAGCLINATFTRANEQDGNGNYRAVSTNINFGATNLANASNGSRPFDWYYAHFISPTFTHENRDYRHAYYKLERIIYGTTTGQFINDTIPKFSVSGFLSNTTIPGGATVDFPGTNYVDWYHRLINSGTYVGFNEAKPLTSVANVSNSTEPGAVTTVRYAGSYAGQRTQKGFISTHVGSQWVPDLVNSVSTGGQAAFNLLDSLWSDADGLLTFSVKRPAYYAIVKNNNLCPYNGLDSLIYRAVSPIYDAITFAPQDPTTPVPNVWGRAEYGDCHIARFDYVNTSTHLGFNGSDDYLDPFNASANREKSIISNDIKFFVESPINMGLTSNNTNGNFSYYPYALYANNTNLLFYRDDYHNGSIDSDTEGRSWQEIAYIYNRDFSKLNIDNAYFPLPYTYNYCSRCINRFKHRITWSEKSFSEETSDLFKVFRINNYKDIPAETGQIINISEFQNKLLIDTEESRWIQQASYQALETNESNISIGTGVFLSLEPQKLYTSDTGFFGSQSRFVNKYSEYGMFSLDARGRRAFLAADLSPRPISSNGLSVWFRDNASIKLKSQIEELTGDNYDSIDWDTPMNIYNPVGYITAFDNKFSRLILVKHDYLLTDYGIELFNNGDLVLNDYKWNLDGFLIEPKFRSDIFENHSWTLSFSFKDMVWASWHSYIPTFITDTKYNMYSYDNGKIFKHNKYNKYLNYYGTLHPHIIEGVSTTRQQDSSIFDHLSFNTNAKQWDDESKSYIDKRFVTFNKLMVYNSYQNSGLLNLITKKKSEFWTRQFQVKANESFVDVNEKLYSINGFKDLVIDYTKPMFNSSWGSIKNNYYIDKVVETSNVNFQKDWRDKQSFRDRHLIFRLYFTIFENIKLTTNISLFKTTKSIR